MVLHRTGTLLITALIALNCAQARALSYTFNGFASARFAHHTESRSAGPASQRADLDLQQKIVLNPRWTLMLAGRSFYENAYNFARDRYPGYLHDRDSFEARAQDAYLQYQNGGFVLRAGNQQVVWGEMFANMQSDVVNPRDLREGLYASTEYTRRSIPMIFGKYVAGGWSAEILGIPRPEFHVLPLPGSDYAPLSSDELRASGIDIDRETYRWGFEPGGRLTKTFDPIGTDVSLFAFNHYDRFPYYDVMPGSSLAGGLRLHERHGRVNTFGLGMAKDWEGYIGRLELVYHSGRRLPVRGPLGAGNTLTDEQIVVTALDFPTWHRLNFSLQFSSSHLTEFKSYLLRFTDQNIGAARALWTVFDDSTLEMLVSKSFLDDGARFQLEFMTPVTSAVEFRIGGEVYGGPKASELGRLHEASRLFVSLKGYLTGIKPKSFLNRFR